MTNVGRPQALHELAMAHGIYAEYHDIWGTLHTLQPHTAAQILTAMGVDVSSDDAMERALAAHRERDWLQPLAAVTVLTRGDQSNAVLLALPADSLEQQLTWRLREEGGAIARGTVRVGDLEVAETADLSGRTFHRRRLVLPDDLPLGYHTLGVCVPSEGGASHEETSCVIVAPPTCYVPECLAGDGRTWGLAVQLYALRSHRNFGVGDFTDLRHLIDLAAEGGAGIVGLNPLHELFWHNPAHCSPYSPSSRLFINPIYIDVEATMGFDDCEEAQACVSDAAFQERVRMLRESELVDYPAVAACKTEVLEAIYRDFRKRDLAADTARARAFFDFVAAGGEELLNDARFNVLQEHFAREQPDAPCWPSWSEDFREPSAPEVAAFAEQRIERVHWFLWLQWQADAQLAAMQRYARERGLGVGLYRDLAVGTDRAGADTWASDGIYAAQASVGAPPDELNLEGQNWGLPPPVPTALRASGYGAIIGALRANMRHAGALRIDHVMGLMRLYWIPPDTKASEGAYVGYPFEELMSILALESRRNQCMVIGEDLGTVPPVVREAATRSRVLSYRILWFERHQHGELKSPSEYPAQAAVAAATHDVPTLAGYWQGRDLTWRSELDLFPTEELRRAHTDGRPEERARLLRALEREGLLPLGLGTDPSAVPEFTLELALAVQSYLARSPCKVMVVQLEDILGEVEQCNLPGTVDEHPNWRRKVSIALEELGAEPRFVRTTAALRQTR